MSNEATLLSSDPIAQQLSCSAVGQNIQFFPSRPVPKLRRVSHRELVVLRTGESCGAERQYENLSRLSCRGRR